MAQFTIDKGVPVPGRSKYPFANLEIGDSFLVGKVDAAERNRVTSAAINYGKRKNVRFASRSTDGGFRIWRVA